MQSSRFSILVALGLALSSLLSPLPAGADVSEQDQARALTLLKELIPYRTAKSYGQVPGMADHFATTLTEAGFRAQDIVRVPLDIGGELVSGLIVRYPGRETSSLAPALWDYVMRRVGKGKTK